MPEQVKRIIVPEMSMPKGHYSHGSQYGDFIFISGQLPDSLDPNEASFRDQVRCALDNMLVILRSAGGTPEDLLKVTAYIVDVKRWPEFNTIYAEVLEPVKSARVVVPVPELHYGYLVEVEAIAARQT